MAIRNELLELGATVSNLGPAPRTVMDIGSQFETFSSLADRRPNRSSTNRPKENILRPKRSYIESTQADTDGNIYYSDNSTETSTHYDIFSENELDDEEHDGMNYHLILNQNRDGNTDNHEPQFQQSKIFIILFAFEFTDSFSSSKFTHHYSIRSTRSRW